MKYNRVSANLAAYGRSPTGYAAIKSTSSKHARMHLATVWKRQM